jgi:nicotinate-nucleotide adenylyltransferase
MAGLMRKMRVGFFGGTFDPPHVAHGILAQEACYQLKLDSLQWLITPDPPHKREAAITPIQHRLNMLDLIVQRVPDFAISRIDLERRPPYYAVDSVELARKQFPGSQIIYLLGEDSLQDLPVWHQPIRFLEELDQLAVAPRPGVFTQMEDIERHLPGITQKATFLTGVMLEISSSLIRERIKAGAPYRHFLDNSVADYIEKHELYQGQPI